MPQSGFADSARSHIPPEMEETARSLQLQAQLTPVGSSGQFDAVLEHLVRVGPQPEPRGDAPRARDYTAERIVSVARWPAEGCNAGELPLPAEGSLFEITPSEVLRKFTLDLPLRWSDGSETRLTLVPSATGVTCLAAGRSAWSERYDYSFQEDDPVLFGQPIELAISTADGRFQATIQAYLQYEADKDGGLRRAWLLHYVGLPAGDAGGWSGIEPDQELAIGQLGGDVVEMQVDQFSTYNRLERLLRFIPEHSAAEVVGPEDGSLLAQRASLRCPCRPTELGARSAPYADCRVCRDGDDVCSMIDGPDTFQVAALEDDEVGFKVDSAPLPIRHQAVVTFRGTGVPDGLRISSGRAGCMSMEGDSYTHCSVFVDIQPGDSFRVGIHGAKPGHYDLEGRLYDYVNVESLLEPPVCHVSSQITVDPAD